MAISARAEGTWAAYTNDGTVAIPAGATTTDMMYLLASWKDFSVTAQVSGWTEAVQVADGSVASGNGTGSMKVGIWYKEHSGSESNPTLDFSGAVIGGAVIIVFQKGAGETWDAPTVSSVIAFTAATNISGFAGAFGGDWTNKLAIGLIGVRDDSATFTRSATAAIVDAGLTWAANYVEYPATHFSTTTGNDMSCDAGYRLAASGTSSNMGMNATLSASETAAGVVLQQSVTAAAATFAPPFRHNRRCLIVR